MLNDLLGCGVYNKYTIESAYEILNRVNNENLNKNIISDLIKNYCDINKFGERIKYLIK